MATYYLYMLVVLLVVMLDDNIVINHAIIMLNPSQQFNEFVQHPFLREKGFICHCAAAF